MRQAAAQGRVTAGQVAGTVAMCWHRPHSAVFAVVHAAFSLNPLTPENFCNKCATRRQHVRHDRQGGKDELQLHILVQVMQPGDVRGSVTNDEVCVAAVKLGDDGARG